MFPIVVTVATAVGGCCSSGTLVESAGGVSLISFVAVAAEVILTLWATILVTLYSDAFYAFAVMFRDWFRVN